jgi:hypothetical protein
MSGAKSEVVTVVLGRFDPVVGAGLVDVLRGDRRLQVLASGLAGAKLDDVLVRESPQVVVLSEVARSLLHVRKIALATRVLLLAHDPSRADGMTLTETPPRSNTKKKGMPGS